METMRGKVQNKNNNIPMAAIMANGCIKLLVKDYVKGEESTKRTD